MTAGFVLAKKTAVGLLPVLLVEGLLRSGVGIARVTFEERHSQPGSPLSALAWRCAAFLACAVIEALIFSATDGAKLLRFQDRLSGGTRNLRQILWEAIRRYPRMAVVMVFSEVTIAFGVMACFVPGILLGTFFGFVEQEVMLADSSVWSSFLNSFALARLVYWRLVALVTTQMVVVALVVLSARVAQAIWSLSASQTELAAAVATAIAGVVVSFLMDAFVTVLYARLRENAASRIPIVLRSHSGDATTPHREAS